MSEKKNYELPKPIMYIQCDLNYAINTRRSVRRFDEKGLTKQQISNLLWACQGITDTRNNYRASPSAGATYPFDVYIQITNTKDIDDGIYKYEFAKHELSLHKSGDHRPAITRACFNQSFINQGPITIILVADYKRTSSRYGERATRYVHMEAGHIGQNIYLEAVGNELATVAIGAFNDNDVKKIMEVEHDVLYIYPVGSRP